MPPVDVMEFWLEDLPRSSSLACPRCGCVEFTVEFKEYGFEFACFHCPTYIGARK